MKNKIKKDMDNIKSLKPINFMFGSDIPVEWVKQKRKKNIITARLDIVVFALKRIIFPLIILRLLLLTISFDFFGNDDIKKTLPSNKYSRVDITDRNGEILAVNHPTFDLYVKPNNIIYPENSAMALVKILKNLKYDDVLKKLKSKKKFIYIARKISPTKKEEIILLGEPGLGFIENDFRFYPQRNLFSHIIGNVDIDNKGISGIEKYIDQNSIAGTSKPVVLSVALYIQDAIRENLVIAMKKFNAKSAAGVVMDVKTGEILGMVSLPDFNSREVKEIILDHNYNNHVTLDVYEMGSVMKIFNTALAIENNYPSDKIFDISKPFMIGNSRIRDSHPKKFKINMEEAFIYSSNIASAIIAGELGEELQTKLFRKLNFFSKMNFELPEKGFPIFPKKWDKFVNASAAYGYGISMTLLHTITAVNAIINDGMYVEPTILKRNENSLLKSYQVVSSKTSEAIKRLMRQVVTEGTGYMANIKNVKAGGKTGTAHKLIDGNYDDTKIRTFFVSIFPAENPKYTMLIMMDEANNNGCYSSTCTTVPISAKIIQEISPMLNLNLK